MMSITTISEVARHFEDVEHKIALLECNWRHSADTRLLVDQI
jgi:hypothetical protein